MTITIDNETTTQAEEAVFLLDLRSVHALPVGTLLKEVECGDLSRIEVIGENEVAVTWANDGKQLTRAASSYLIEPLQVLNPEILGKFPKHEVGDKVTVLYALGGFEVGDVVEVTETRPKSVYDYRVTGIALGKPHTMAVYEREIEAYVPPAPAPVVSRNLELAPGVRVRISGVPFETDSDNLNAFIGLTATIHSVEHEPFVTPHRERPDGFGTSSFYWTADCLTPLPDQIGQRVEVISNRGDSFAVVGSLGTVITVDNDAWKAPIIGVQQDDGQVTYQYEHRFKRIADEPEVETLSPEEEAEIVAAVEEAEAEVLPVLAVGDLVTTMDELDGLPVGAVLVGHDAEGSAPPPNVKLMDCTWARFNRYATADKLRSKMGSGWVYTNEEQQIAYDLGRGRAYRVIYLPA